MAEVIDDVDMLRVELDKAIKQYTTAWLAQRCKDDPDEDLFTPDKTVVVGWVVGVQMIAFGEGGKPGDDMLPIIMDHMPSYAAVGVSRILATEIEDDARGMNLLDEDD